MGRGRVRTRWVGPVVQSDPSQPEPGRKIYRYGGDHLLPSQLEFPLGDGGREWGSCGNACIRKEGLGKS